MTGDKKTSDTFCEIALELNFIDDEQLDRALVVQKRIFEKTRVSMPIGDVLIEMGAITPDEKKEIIQARRELEVDTASLEKEVSPRKKRKRSNAAKNGETLLDINVSKDKLKAFIHLIGEVPTTEFDVNDVKLMLHSGDILNGIEDDSMIKAYLNGEFSVSDPWAIASGTQPIPDTPPQIVYHFDTDPLKIGTLTENGLMDWKDRGRLPQVREGDLLAEKIPGPKGKEGMDVFGKIIPIPKLKEKTFKCGKGARRSAGGNLVHATLSGIPKRSISGELSVVQTLYIDGDICLETGHVDFDGHIEVTGVVEKGYRVKGGSLCAKEIRNSELEIEGDITAINGIFGAVIRSNGNLKAGHIHNADIVLKGDMAVEKEIIESTVEVNGRCLINDGIILSSMVSAKMGIIAMDIGTQAAKSTELMVGIDRQLEREADTTKSEIQRIKTEQESLPEKIKALKERSDQVNTELGEVAQLQDKCMVRHRRLQEKVEAGMLQRGGPAADKLMDNMNGLKEKQDGYDRDVTRFMAEDESIGDQIASLEKLIDENASTIVELKNRLDVITEAQKTNLGVSTVKIGGNICSGTSITGPNSVLILDKDLKRLSIVETNRPDHDGVKHWRMELSPYR